MLVGVLSDSHDNIVRVRQAVELFNDRGVDVVFHLGDIVSPFTLRVLGGLEAEVYVVFGNNDGDKLLLSRVARESGLSIVEQPLVVEVAGLKIIAVHGWGSKDYTRGIVDSLASSGRYDVVLYGHTHEVDVRRRAGGVLIVNPGEVYGYLTGRSTIAIMDSRGPSVEVVEL